MDFKTFLKENLSQPIDDNDVLNTLDGNDITYTRIKMDNGSLLYSFDNRYSIIYDGFVFILYRQGNKVHMANARNLKEIQDSISKWTESYTLASPDESVSDEEIDDFITRLKDNAKDDGADNEGKKADTSEDDMDDSNEKNDDSKDDSSNDDKSNKKKKKDDE